ncbi:D-xylulose reductase [Salix suchowensis]|nr:D-xylulose reductase [Salix suchowensis]
MWIRRKVNEIAVLTISNSSTHRCITWFTGVLATSLSLILWSVSINDMIQPVSTCLSALRFSDTSRLALSRKVRLMRCAKRDITVDKACAVGSNVKHVKPGDRVAMEPGATCSKPSLPSLDHFVKPLPAPDAQRNARHLCPDIIFAATPPYDGTLARYYRLPADLAYPLPDGVSLEDGAMILSRLDWTSPRTTQPRMFTSRSRWSKVNLARIQQAERRRNEEAVGHPRSRPKWYRPRPRRSGAEVSIQTGFFVAKTGGTFVQVYEKTLLLDFHELIFYRKVGMGNPDVTINLSMLMTKELVYKGSFRYGVSDCNINRRFQVLTTISSN